jgi:hypothetical protein
VRPDPCPCPIWALAALALVACQCGTGKDAAPAPKPAPDANAFPVARDAGEDVREPDVPVVPEEPVVEDIGAEDLGAVPAWRAVTDRDFYLARRGQHGVVYGKLVTRPRPGSGAGTGTGSGTGTGDPTPARDELMLVDETEGNGALAIRVRFADGATPPVAGSRVALGGAWALDDQRRWIWQVDAVTALTGEAPKKVAPDPESAPGHVVASGPWPAGAKVRPPDKVKEGEIMLFTVVSVPKRTGDGWGVSDQKWGRVLGYVRLPGEHHSYGGHELLAPDERWSLKKQGTYWVRVGKVRRKDSEPAIIEAVTAPVKP